MTGAALVLRYAAFAVLATLANIGSQWLVFRADDGALAIWAALVVGAGVGLVVKYLLDKTWIFEDRETGLRAHGRKFTLYTVMGLATTAIFWGFELAFHLAFEADAMRYLGGVLGLAIGYVVKYRLDRRFVFAKA